MERSRPPWEERGAGGGRGKGSRGRGLKAGVASSMSFADVRSSHPSHTHTYFFFSDVLYSSLTHLLGFVTLAPLCLLKF